jgi:hypothetical protein
MLDMKKKSTIKQVTKKSFTFRFDGIEIIEKHLFQYVERGEGSEFDFNVSVQTNLEAKNKLAVYFVRVNVIKKSENRIIASITTACGFEIQNFDEAFPNGSKDEYLADRDLDLALKNISISTTRGVMFGEFRGTPMHNAILPIIDPSTLVTHNKPILEK